MRNSQAPANENWRITEWPRANTRPLLLLMFGQKKWFSGRALASAFNQSGRHLATAVNTVWPPDARKVTRFSLCSSHAIIRGSIQKFPDWLLRARTANGIALCH
jgi:hypothetical protein